MKLLILIEKSTRLGFLLKHFKFILVEFNTRYAPTKNILWQYFYESFKLFI